MQSFALQLTTVLVLVVFAAFTWVLTNTKRKVDIGQVAPGAYRLRSILFIVASIVGVLISYKTLTPWPHTEQQPQVTRSIDVKARQWAWDLSDTKAKVGEVIEFKVTSEDVNHGFALYGPDMKVVAQVQVMPDFVNKVQYKFEKPGKYQILCLEYCGVAHHGMVAEFEVN